MSIAEYKKYNSCVCSYNKLYKKIKKEYNQYEIKHEKELDEIQNNIDRINKIKPVLKYILEKESNKLREMGIDSEVSDYPEESIDNRNFNLKEEYNIIFQENLSIKEPISQDEDDAYYAYKINRGDVIEALFSAVFSYFGNKIEDSLMAYKLSKKIKKLQEKQRMISEHISADLTKLMRLKDSLKNISDSYKIIKDSLADRMENKIRDIEERYNNNFNEIPTNILQMMHSSSKIMKEISEKRIIPKGFSVVDSKEVIECENRLLELQKKLNDNLDKYDKELYNH